MGNAIATEAADTPICEPTCPEISTRTWLAGQALTAASAVVAEWSADAVLRAIGSKEEYTFEAHYARTVAKVAVQMADAIINELR